MKNPLISVIVPVYKVEKYLDRCIESIVNQTYDNLEIILVDDGSPDNCPEMCDEWAKRDDRIKIIHKENEGVFRARNVGIEESCGEYLAFVDSDDWISQDYFDYLLKLCLDNDLNISCVSYQTVRKSDKTIPDTTVEESIEIYSFKDIVTDFSKGLCYLWGKLYNRKVFDNIPPLPDKLTVSEDALLSFFILKNGNKLVYSNEKKYYYFRHIESVMAGNITYKMIDDSMLAYKTMNSYTDQSADYFIYQVYNTVMSDFFLLNSIIRNNTCKDRYAIVRDDILSYKKYIFDKNNRSVFGRRHILGVFLLNISPKLYNASIIIRKKIRGY
ncbi:MAG: glycosyltransferase family 2 protein [Eubacterium sp.]